jgi:hypothetical protein
MEKNQKKWIQRTVTSELIDVMECKFCHVWSVEECDCINKKERAKDVEKA